MIDPIADMITRIRNAYLVNKASLKIPFSKINWEILQILKSEGFINEVDKIGRSPKYMINIGLLYDGKKPAINEIKKVSKSSQRVYRKTKELWPYKGNRGVRIVSTPKGVMTDKKARQEKVGGEILIEVW
ncbi:MAG: 30S ribosomal protein S8 [Parcubacteria group bacterium ADurb.Bin305]|jgi:small subunit ribosomal protein S8|nr:30S ribosomal protein S8 [Candidatus Paceibacterota bacterium]MDD3434753.1 30S ribosomal protein S8 [Candidatus Paceibacterota bacterium]OQA44134.1 MAG: 30S ribosomal protein S8 [Parcubacteria group bacterium ADurb.Bin305]